MHHKVNRPGSTTPKKGKKMKNYISKVLALLIGISLLLSNSPFMASANPVMNNDIIQVDQTVLNAISRDGTADFIVQFDNKADLTPAFSMTWEDRGWFVYNTLVAQMEKSQASVKSYLSNAGVTFQSFWIDNSLHVKDSGITILNAIESFDGIKSIKAPQTYQIYQPETGKPSELMATESNLVHVQAPEAWALGINGEGITIGSIDSGVRYTHEALQSSYRGNDNGTFDHDYNWLDPYTSHYQAPRDDSGHGTHTVGTMVGDNGSQNKTGIAPGAQWIACRGCSTNQCADAELLACAQFMVAPTKLDGSEADPEKRPAVINNSWGDCGQEYNGWFQDAVNTWHAAGIYPVFSNGNNSACGYPGNPPLGTVGNPARYGNVSGVGSTGTNNGQYAYHSNKGPTDNPDSINPIEGFEDMKPQFVAPGVDIRSSVNDSDTSYEWYTGTSMSAPHVSGLVSMIIQAGPCLKGNYGAIETIIEQTATPIPFAYLPDEEPTTPNFATGWGEINALAAVQAAAGACGSYTISGTVRSDAAGNPPVEGVSIEASADGQALRRAVTSADGSYSINVDPGLWTITASKFGFDTTTAGPVEVTTDNVTVDIEMHAHAQVKLEGTVRDGGPLGGEKHGYPLYAKVVITTDGFTETLFTDPFTGHYQTSIYPALDYTLTVTAVLPGYETITRPLTTTEDVVENFDLTVQAACSAPGYQRDYQRFYTFEEGDEGFVSGGENSSWARGRFTSGPEHAISGSYGIATNPAGIYNPNEQSWMVSPAIDLSAAGDKTPVIQFWSWLFTESATSAWDTATFQVSKDGGQTWNNIWGPYPAQNSDFRRLTFVLDTSYNVENFMMRFFFKSNTRGERAGWYIDDIGLATLELPAPNVVAEYHFDDPAEPAWTPGFVSGDNDWEQGAPTTGPGQAHSGDNVWATQLNGNYSPNRVSHITSPTLDLSDYEGMEVEVQWYDWSQVENPNYNYDFGTIWASFDDGASWRIATETIKRKDTVGGDYTASRFVLGKNFVTSTFKLRFQFASDFSDTELGWYIDDVVILTKQALSDIVIPCTPINGGLVAGYVFDKNFPGEEVRLMEATVTSATSSAMTEKRANDAQHDGLYMLFQPVSGEDESVNFTIAKKNYGTKDYDRVIKKDIVNHENFEIGAGLLVTDPAQIDRTIPLFDDDETMTIHVVNNGGGMAGFELFEANLGFQPLNQHNPARKINIPAFVGELKKNDVPTSMHPDPNAKADQDDITVQLAPQAALFDIDQAPPAVGAEIRTYKLLRWNELISPGTFTELGSTLPITGIYAGDFLRKDYNHLYAISSTTKTFYKINTADAKGEVIANLTLPTGYAFTGLTGASNFFYASVSDCAGNSGLSKVELDGTVTHIAPIVGGKCIIDLAYVPAENMVYAIDIQTDNLFRINPETGDSEVVGQLGFDSNFSQSMDYDEVNEIMYWAAYSTTAELRVIDIHTGASMKIGEYPSNTVIDAFAIEAYAGGSEGPDLVTWLDETPIEGSVDEAERFPIQLTFTVKDIDQPGDYFAELRFVNDSPFQMDPVPVTLHVVRPHTWGTFKGEVIGTQKCDLNPAPLANATINFYKDGAVVHSTTTDQDGSYSYALERGTYDIEALFEGHVAMKVESVEIAASEDLVIDFTLRFDSACLTFTPQTFYAELFPNQTSIESLTFTNTGTQEATFELQEIPGPSAIPFSVVELALDDGTTENALGIGGRNPFMWLNRFTPKEADFPFKLEKVLVYWDTNGMIAPGDVFDIYIYENTSGAVNPAEGATFLYKQSVTADEFKTFQEYTLTDPVLLEGPGDVLIGIGAVTVPGMGYWPAAIDHDTPAGRSWLGWWAGDIPEIPNLPPDAQWMNVDAIGPGSWLVRGIGTTNIGGEPGEIVWLSEEPSAGLLEPNGDSQEVTLTFDSTELTWGDYFGTLRVSSDADRYRFIPVQLRVKPLNLLHLPLIQIFEPGTLDD